MLKYLLSAALLATALPALAQPPAAGPQAGPPAALQAAAIAFGQCVEAGIDRLPGTVTPEAGATTILGGCAAQRQELERVAEGFIAASVPAANQAAAREQMRAQLAQAETHVAQAIRQKRAGGTPAPSN